jgi:hypothetical protein
MIREIIEMSDRWILPLRGSIVVGVDWGPEITFELEPPGQIVAGQGAILGQGAPRDIYANPATIGEQGVDRTRQIIGAEILSSVGFKSGDMRIAFRGQWLLIVDSDAEFVPASVRSGDSLIWERPPAT